MGPEVTARLVLQKLGVSLAGDVDERLFTAARAPVAAE
jgi:hypothetical protein